MNENMITPDRHPRIFDAYKSWLCCLITFLLVAIDFRGSILFVQIISIVFSLMGLVFGVRALTRGPLRFVGGVFLVINAFLFLSILGNLIFRLHSK
jgi:hypothetical protein